MLIKLSMSQVIVANIRVHTSKDYNICTEVLNIHTYMLEMQRYTYRYTVSSYCDTLGSDTESIHILIVSIYPIS